MIDKSYVQLMSRYNEWQNANLSGAADKLSDDERKRTCGAFFGSIHATLDHLLWGDQIWISRFAAHAEARKAASRARSAAIQSGRI